MTFLDPRALRLRQRDRRLLQQLERVLQPVLHPGLELHVALELVAVLDEQLENLEYRASLAPEMEKLPERERTILYLRFFKGMTQSEIADRLGISQMHVSRLLNRTLMSLREALETTE